MLDFALGFFCALGLIFVSLYIYMHIFAEDTGEVVKQLPGGGIFRTRPDNRKARDVRIKAGLSEGELSEGESYGSTTRRGGRR